MNPEPDPDPIHVDRRRFLGLALGGAAVLAAGACGSSGPSNGATDPSNGATDTLGPSQIASKPITLDFWTISFFNGKTGKEEGGKPQDYYNWQIAQFKALHPNVTITPTFIPSSFEGWAKFDTSIAAGTPPDVMWGQAGNQWKYAPLGAIEPFDEYMPKTQMDDILPSTKSMIQYIDGKTYLWPYGIACAGGLFINSDLARAAGAESMMPQSRERDWTTDQFLSLAHATTRGSGTSKVYGTALMTDWTYQVSQFLYGFGADMFNPNQTKMTINSSQGVQGLQWLVDLEHKQGVCAPGSSGRKNSQVLQMFLQQKIAIYPAQPYFITAFRSAPETKPSFKWQFVQPPHVASQPMAAEANVHGYIVPKQSDPAKLQMAMEFVKFLTRPEALSIDAAGQGLVPPLQSMLKAWAGDDPDFYVETLITKAAKPWARLYTTLGPTVIEPMYDSAFSLQKPPTQALNDAVAAGNQIIDAAAKKYHWPSN